MRNQMILAILTLSMCLLPPPAPAQARRAEMRIPQVRSDMLVSTDWLARHLTDPAVVVLQVGEKRSDYEAGHIPGARFVALNDLVLTRGTLRNELPPAADLKRLFEAAGVGDKSRVILYGDWLGLLAARAWFTLDYLGHGDRAALLDGGLEKWRAENRPLSKEVPSVTPATFTPHINPGAIVQLPVMQDLSFEAAADKDARVVLVDARPPEEYAGTKAHDGIPRAGHIPGAISLYWKRTLESEDDPQILPPSELRRLYAEVGAMGDKKIVSYCVTGIQAAHVYFTAKYLGYDAALYDGSFAEWSNAPGTAVETTSK